MRQNSPKEQNEAGAKVECETEKQLYASKVKCPKTNPRKVPYTVN